MEVEKIARVTHEANRAYCQSMGDLSQPTWAEAPAWQKSSAIKGVEFALANPDATPLSMHESWSAEKINDGWVWGSLKDAEKKTHPCLVHYDLLPDAQRAKDHLFLGIIRSLQRAGLC